MFIIEFVQPFYITRGNNIISPCENQSKDPTGVIVSVVLILILIGSNAFFAYQWYILRRREHRKYTIHQVPFKTDSFICTFIILLSFILSKNAV